MKKLSNDEKIARLEEILHDSRLCNAAKFELMEEIVLGGKEE